MSEKKINRRDFLKVAGLAGISLPTAKIVGNIDGYNLVESPEQYGGFLVKKLGKEGSPYEIDPETFERIHEYDTMFGRTYWDKDYKAEKADIPRGVKDKKREDGVPGWSPFEFALALGAEWLHDNKRAGSYDWVTEPNEVESEIKDVPVDVITQNTKTAALYLGASGVGIAEANEDWFYQSVGRMKGLEQELQFDDVAVPPQQPENFDLRKLSKLPKEEWPEVDPAVSLPKKLNRVIVLVHEMEYDTLVPNGMSQLSAAGNKLGYSHMAFVAPSLALYIRSLGYQAIPMGNDTGISTAMAWEAGLGEQGRNGLLVTPKWGPRVRISKVLTDLPLDVDSPISFGVKEFCEQCELCADHCPSGSIPHGDSFTFDTFDINNQKGVKKWQVDTKHCHLYWGEMGTACSNCITVCPFNKPDGWLHDATRILIGAKSGPLDSLMKNMDQASGYGSAGASDIPDAEAVDFFWKEKTEFMHTKR